MSSDRDIHHVSTLRVQVPPQGGTRDPPMQARFLAGLFQRGLMKALAAIDRPFWKDPESLPEGRNQAKRGAIAKAAKRNDTHLRDPART